MGSPWTTILPETPDWRLPVDSAANEVDSRSSPCGYFLPLSQYLFELRRVERLPIKLSASGFPCARFQIFLRQTGYGNNSSLLEAGLVLQLGGQVFASEVGQAHVDDDDVRPKLRGQVESSESIDGVLRFVTHHADQRRHGTSGVKVVLDYKHSTFSVWN